MNANECILTRRSIRHFKNIPISHEFLEEIISIASFSPSWKNTQVTRFIAVEGELKEQIATNATSLYPNNGTIIKNAPMLIAVTVVKNRCGFERDGSYTTFRKDTWQMFDAGIASQTFCLAAHDRGIGSVILGIFDQDTITDLLGISNDQELVALIPIGYPDEEPAAPKRKTVSDLLTYK